MGDAMFRFTFEDGEYDLTRVTRSELSHFKSWYGPDYGEKLTLTIKALRRDADAMACLMWACRRENSLTPNPDPRNMPDFDPDDVLAVKTEDELEEQKPAVPLDVTDSI